MTEMVLQVNRLGSPWCGFLASQALKGQSETPYEKFQQSSLNKKLIWSIAIHPTLMRIIRPSLMQMNQFYYDYLWLKMGIIIETKIMFPPLY